MNNNKSNLNKDVLIYSLEIIDYLIKLLYYRNRNNNKK
jgi:hypothetical protein